ncbi:MAG TPA: chemotaxis protein CheW, partial [Gammaproteobacteria bacterium]|nr:chemotaxis protein CheW [Gammaproteobacteria bacterium]
MGGKVQGRPRPLSTNHLPAKGLTDLNKVIIVHDPSMEFGILADALLGVRSIPIEEIQASLPTLTGIRE